MGQEHTSPSAIDHSRIMPSTIGDSNGVSTRLHAQARAQTDALPELTTEELVRYDRHLLLPQVGVEGQRKLKAASVLLIGAGGLGSPLALYLAAAGVGRISIVDFDVVDKSNLQRQILHGTKDTGRPKLLSATDRLHDLNPHIHIDTYETMLRANNGRCPRHSAWDCRRHPGGGRRNSRLLTCVSRTNGSFPISHPTAIVSFHLVICLTASLISSIRTTSLCFA
jgi:hypothetical protein